MAGKKRKRSERPTIHPRNKYSDNSPDFGQLASLYPSFEPFVFYSHHGWPSIDWTDFNATRELTRVLLLHDHGLNWWIPDGQLCPTVPNRSNYIHWIEDLLSSDIIEKNQTNIEGKIVRGFDIGTGANCIYPLLGASLLGWSFVGSDMTDVAIEWAEANVKNNPQISKLIEIRKVKKLTDGEGDVTHPESSSFMSEEASSLVAGESYVGPNILVGVVLDDEKFDFCMCNPPFFEKMEESGLNPQTSCGGTLEEMVCAGGERAFIGRIIEDSVKLKRQFRWYTSMVGKKCNLKILLKKLREIGVTVVKTTEFVQGRTSRWGLAWSFVPPARKIISLHIAEKNVLSFTLEGIQKYSAINVLQTVESFFRSSGASCKSDLSTYTVNVTASSEQCTMAILRNGQEMTTKSDCEHLPANEMSLHIVVFQQNPGTLLVRGSLQHQQNPSTGKGMFTLVFQTLEETLRREFCKERATGRRPDLGELFLETHSKRFTSSDRSPAATHEVQSKATELSNAQVQNPHMSRFEITESVFGQQTNERVIGIGSGVTPRTFRQNQRGSSSSSNSTQESDMKAVLEQNKALMEQIALMRVQQEEMRAQQEMMQRQMTAQQEMMQRQMAAQQEMMQRQMADILAKFGVPPPPPS